MKRQIEVLVIGRPSRFRDSLTLLLTSMSPIEKIHLADDMASAFKKNGSPAVLIVDAAVGNGQLTASINKIRNIWPLAGLIFLVEDDLEFQTAAAIEDVVLLCKGFPAAKFIKAVKSLLSK